MSNTQTCGLVAASYELVAQEYYDSERHPTCSNFREASLILLRKWRVPILQSRSICEVGPGRSLVAEFVLSARGNLDRLVLVDESASMLAFSEKWGDAGATLKIGSAFSLPLPSNAFDLVVSCLGDPYNALSFWTEVRRVLIPGGTCLFTTPSFDWAHSFRKGGDVAAMDSADFTLLDGTHVQLPSFILSPTEQARLIQSAGLTLEQESHTFVRDLQGLKISPKLLAGRNQDATVVTGYVATKR